MLLGVSGVMTMKIINSTNKMSISGTTFISAIAPPLLSPTLIPIAILLSAHPCEGLKPWCRAGWEPARHRNLFQKLPSTNGATLMQSAMKKTQSALGGGGGG